MHLSPLSIEHLLYGLIRENTWLQYQIFICVGRDRYWQLVPVADDWQLVPVPHHWQMVPVADSYEITKQFDGLVFIGVRFNNN